MGWWLVLECAVWVVPVWSVWNRHNKRRQEKGGPALRESTRESVKIATPVCATCGGVPELTALATCYKCGQHVCADCLRVVRVGDEYKDSCPACQGQGLKVKAVVAKAHAVEWYEYKEASSMVLWPLFLSGFLMLPLLATAFPRLWWVWGLWVVSSVAIKVAVMRWP